MSKIPSTSMEKLKKTDFWKTHIQNACLFCQGIFSRFILDFDRTLFIIQGWIAIGIGSEQKTVLGTVIILAVNCHILKSNFCEKQEISFQGIIMPMSI